VAGLADLVNNIQGSFKNLANQLFGSEKTKAIPKYPKSPEYLAIQADINQSNWNKLAFPYTFSIIDISDGTVSADFGDFALPLAPQSITQREAPAITITPTQGGTTVNHSGIGYKTLNISGTTGIAPFRGSGGVQAKTGVAIFQPDELKYHSGYEVFLALRNWIRTYYEYKYRQGTLVKDLRLVFKNYKDGEFLIVELESFDMDRQAARRFLYDYKIQFQVLANYTFKSPAGASGFLASVDSLVVSALNAITTARGVFLKSQNTLRQIESTYESTVLEPLRQASLAIKALQGIALVSADVSNQAIKNTVTAANTLGILLGIESQQSGGLTGAQVAPYVGAILLPADLSAASTTHGSAILTNLGAGGLGLDISVLPPKTIAAAKVEQRQATQLPRNYYNAAIQDLVRVKQNAEDFFNLGSSSYDSLFGRTSTLSPNSNSSVTADQYEVLNAFNEALNGLYLLLSTSDLFKASLDQRIDDMVSRFAGNITLFSTQAVKQVTITANMTLERLALNELGDSTRWGEIVELNNMKYPYLSTDPLESRDGVFTLGSKVLIPAHNVNGFSQVPEGATNRLNVDYSAVEKSLGVDLKLDGNFDLALTSSGDLDLIGSTDNLAQAILLKLSYEKGDLILYPSIGVGLDIGEKFPALKDIQDGIVASILQDSRVDKISDLNISQDNGALFLNFTIYVKNVDLPVPLSIKL
jgi:nucleoid-associated protein YgaU